MLHNHYYFDRFLGKSEEILKVVILVYYTVDIFNRETTESSIKVTAPILNYLLTSTPLDSYIFSLHYLVYI